MSRRPSTLSFELETALEQARTLLKNDETDLPSGVEETVRFFIERDSWFRLSRNPKVLSCRDAARRRYRLGYRGISLADELRSYLAQTRDSAGKMVYVLLHCRGDASVDFNTTAQVSVLRGLTLERADVREFDEDEIGYGLINPFVAPTILGTKGQVIQVFDPSVLDSSGETMTMMTNAGDTTWAVEFDPGELLNEHAPRLGTVENIVSGTYRRHAEESRVIGILTGNAPESGALLWKKVNDGVRRRRGETFRGDISYPRVLVHSLPQMGWSMDLDSRADRLLPLITAEIDQMASNEASVITLACNTTQYFEPELVAHLSGRGATFVGLADPVKSWLAAHRDKTIFIVGIEHVTSTAGWSAFPFFHALPNVKLPDARQSAVIEKVAYDVKRNGINQRTYQKFRSVVRDAHADIVLLLLTEFSMTFDRFPREILGNTRVVDALDLLAEKLVSLSLS